MTNDEDFLMENTYDILSVVCENIGDISSLVNVSHTCKIMKDCAINTTFYKEKKQEKANNDLCANIEVLVISKILKNMKGEDDSKVVMEINEKKKKLNKGCLKRLASIIHDDYCDYCYGTMTDQYIAVDKSPIIKELIVEIDPDYEIFMDNWWIDDEEQTDDMYGDD